MPRTPTACLIIIGNEILSGRTQDIHLSWIAKELNEVGVRLMEARVISDTTDAIEAAVNECRPNYNYIFTTGGIGPTHDDITSASIARAFGVPLKRHEGAEAILQKHYGAAKLNAARLRMADMPEGASLIPNPISAAPGFRIENVYVMAGVPMVMQAMFGFIKGELVGGKKMLSQTITANTTEGVIAEALTEIQEESPRVEIGSYPFFHEGKLGVSLVLRSTDEDALAEAEAKVTAMLRSVKSA